MHDQSHVSLTFLLTSAEAEDGILTGLEVFYY
jgi:hypothetical protein